MPETYNTEQVILLSELPNRRAVYSAALRYGWDVEKVGFQRRFDARKVNNFLTARTITKEAKRLRGWGKNAPLLWPVTKCPRCGRSAAFIQMDIFCIEGHFTEG